MKTYLNDAIIGNKELKVGLTKKGEIVRICYPNVDFRQFIDFMHMGVKINDSNIIYLNNDSNNVYMQEYVEDTNVLKTEVKNTYFNLRMIQTDFVPVGSNTLSDYRPRHMQSRCHVAAGAKCAGSDGYFPASCCGGYTRSSPVHIPSGR